MPISLSAKKSLRKSLKNHKDNVVVKKELKSVIKKFLTKPTAEGLSKVYSILDKTVKKNIFHKNKASRLKAKFAKNIKPATEGQEIKKVAKKKKAVK